MIFDELDILYNDIDGYLSVEEFNARSINDDEAEFQYALKREYNEQAYFLYIFTRLERQIVDNTNKLFQDRENAAVNDIDKRSWRVLIQKKLELMERVSFLTPAGQADYQSVYDLKKHRDGVAHGKYAAGVDLASFILEFKRLSGILVV